MAKYRIIFYSSFVADTLVLHVFVPYYCVPRVYKQQSMLGVFSNVQFPYILYFVSARNRRVLPMIYTLHGVLLYGDHLSGWAVGLHPLARGDSGLASCRSRDRRNWGR